MHDVNPEQFIYVTRKNGRVVSLTRETIYAKPTLTIGGIAFEPSEVTIKVPLVPAPVLLSSDFAI